MPDGTASPTALVRERLRRLPRVRDQVCVALSAGLAMGGRTRIGWRGRAQVPQGWIRSAELEPLFPSPPPVIRTAPSQSTVAVCQATGVVVSIVILELSEVGL